MIFITQLPQHNGAKIMSNNNIKNNTKKQSRF